MKKLALFVLSLMLLFACSDKELTVDANISLDQNSYEVSDTIIVTFEGKSNIPLNYIEAKILNPEQISASPTSTNGIDGKKVEGQLRLTFLDQFHQNGTYTVQVTFGSSDDTHREYAEFTLNTGAEDLNGFLVSETTLGNSNIYLINQDGKELITSEAYPIDLLATNNTYDQISYSFNNNESLKIHSIPNGNILDYTFTSNSSRFFRGGVSDASRHYFCNSEAKIVTSPIDGSAINENKIASFEFDHITEKDDYLYVAAKNTQGNSFRISVIVKSTLASHQDIIMNEEVLDIKNYDDRIFVLTATKLCELNTDQMNLDQLYSSTNMTSLAGMKGDMLFINTPGKYLSFSLSSFLSQETTHQANNVLFVSSNDWMVYNFATYVEVVDYSSSTSLFSFPFDGTAVEMMEIN